MSTTLDPSFLRAVILSISFRGDDMDRACAALLLIGIRGQTFTGADLPAELTNGSKTLAGCACGSLVAQGLVECVGRVKSPHPDAKGRKVNLLQIPANRLSTARTWLARHGFPLAPIETQQLSLGGVA